MKLDNGKGKMKNGLKKTRQRRGKSKKWITKIGRKQDKTKNGLK